MKYLGTTPSNPVYSGTVEVGKDIEGDEAGDEIAVDIDFDRTVPGSGTAAHNDRGIDLDVTSASLGTSSLYGMDIDVVGNAGASGNVQTAYGIHLDVDSADVNYGMVINTAGTHLKLESNAEIADYFAISTSTNGATTIGTVDGSSDNAHLSLSVDGDFSIASTGIDIAANGTITNAVWNGTKVASAYLDDDTAHLSESQTFTGTNIFGGDKEVTPGDGAVIHISTQDIVDDNTSFGATTAKYTHVNIMRPRLSASSGNVTTTAAASLYIQNAPLQSGNQTITNPYALWVDDGLVKFDGALTVSGAITGDLTGNADTATALETGRTINGVSFDGTGNITVTAAGSTLSDTVPASKGGTGVTGMTALKDLLDDETWTFANNITGTLATVSQPNITTLAGVTSIGTSGGPSVFEFKSDEFQARNSLSGKPLISLTNLADDASSAKINFANLRQTSGVWGNGEGGVDNDILGEIYFTGYNSGAGYSIFGRIQGAITESTAPIQGKIVFEVAEKDGFTTGLKIEGQDQDGEIDVTIAAGAASTTTVAGTLTMGSTASMTNIGELSVASQPNITTLAGVSAIGTASTPIVVTSDTVTFESANTDDPTVIIKNTYNDNQAARLQMRKNRTNTSLNNDRIGEIDFVGENDGGVNQQYAKIIVQAKEVDDGDETGMIKFQVAEYDGALGVGLKIEGTDADGVIDATVGLGATSETVVTGTLTTGSTAALTNAGLVAVANQSNITGVGTISSGTWQGTPITETYVPNAALGKGSRHYTDTASAAYGHNTIKILPSDFMQNEGGGVNKSCQFVSDSWGVRGVRATHTDAELWAFVSVPEGMKATETIVYGNGSAVVNVYDWAFNDALTAPAAGTDANAGYGTVGFGESNWINHADLVSTFANCVAIRVTINNVQTETITGGLIKIAAI